MIEKILKDWKKRVGNNLNYKNTDHLFELGSMLTEQGWDSEAIGILIENLKEIDIVRKKQPDGSFGSAYTVKKHNPDRGQQLVKKDASPEDLEKVDKGEPIDTEKDNADSEREKIGGLMFASTGKQDDRWYDWRNFNWGTKWEACDVKITQDYTDFLEITFNTAWSPPKPIAEILRSKYECRNEEDYHKGLYLSINWLYELEGEEGVGYLE